MDYAELEHVQDSQQATQIATQNEAALASIAGGLDSHLFGCLQPCNAAARNLVRIDLFKTHPSYTFGRAHESNIKLPGLKISNHHCVVQWNQKDDHEAMVIIRDLSTNGTFINGEKIGRGQSNVLRDGNEVAFGTCAPQAISEEDYRFIYRQLLGNAMRTGVHAKYDLTHELGKGSFATVVKALKREDGRFYAVKIIHGSKVRGNADKRENAFAREISILQRLTHPNICQLIERFHNPQDENIYVVLEYVEGGDLLEYIIKRDRLSETLTKHLTRQICDALAYVHAQGITHRDLKPENVLLTVTDPPNVKVADFGLAKIVDHLTMLRTMCGTPNYLAPEVVSPGPAGYDQLVDSWSVGVIVFCMLTGCGPFIEDENLDVPERIRTRTIDWRTLREHNLNRNAFLFIKRLLEADPARRMTLTAALHHPWLSGPEYDVPMADDPDSQMSHASSLSEDVSMLSSFPSEFEVDAPVSQSQNRAPLERRSQILAREAEAAQKASPPASSSSPETDNDSPDTRAKRGRDGALKMEAIGEASEELMAQDDSADALPMPKKGRMDVDGDEEEEEAGPTRGKKGASKAPVSTGGKRATRASAAIAAEEEVRRSPRKAGKVRR